jgi:DNA-binding GntR family transcriptional regulator
MPRSGDQLAPAQAVCQALEDDIVTGRLLPGTRLEEPQLARRFGVSRTPVREALHLLSATELVERRLGRGVFVSLVTPERLSAMFDAMAELEAACGRLASRRMSTAERSRLEALHRAMGRAVCEGAAGPYELQNRTFHDAIYGGARSPVLVDLTKATRRRVAPFRRVQFNDLRRLAGSYDEHQRIVSAILQGAEERAATELRTHIMSVHDLAQDYLTGLREKAGRPAA